MYDLNLKLEKQNKYNFKSEYSVNSLEKHN